MDMKRFGEIWRFPLIVVGLSCFLISLSSNSFAEDFSATRIQVLDDNIKCIWSRDRLITSIRGPCDDFVKPKIVAIGESFQANGKVKRINAIIVRQYEKDIPSDDVQRGDWWCVAAEDISQIPGYGGRGTHYGTWLLVQKCKPVE